MAWITGKVQQYESPQIKELNIGEPFRERKKMSEKYPESWGKKLAELNRSERTPVNYDSPMFIVKTATIQEWLDKSCDDRDKLVVVKAGHLTFLHNKRSNEMFLSSEDSSD